MSDLEKLKTEIALLKKDAKTGELIHQRLEVAVDKLTEITVSLKGMIAQQQTKLERAEQTDDDIFITLESRRKEWDNDLKELHSRITTSTKEMTELMTKQHYEADAEMRRMRMDISDRVVVLEKWKYLIVGGSIVVGFIISSYLRYFM